MGAHAGIDNGVKCYAYRPERLVKHNRQGRAQLPLADRQVNAELFPQSVSKQ